MNCISGLGRGDRGGEEESFERRGAQRQTRSYAEFLNLFIE